jgi:hypothetical protein
LCSCVDTGQNKGCADNYVEALIMTTLSRLVRSVVLPLALLTVMPGVTSAQMATLPPGTWAQIPNTAIRSAMPPEAFIARTPGAEPELFSAKNIFAYSGGDLAALNSVLGFLFWGGGHHDSPDNSLYWAPFDGSGSKRLSGPYLAPDGGKGYYLQDKLDHYTEISRNQPGVTVGGAPKSRHTYSCLATVLVNGKPQFFTVGGGMASLSGYGTNATRLFDLSQTYAQAMARPDMGWARRADAPRGTLTCSVGWDSKTGLVVVRALSFWGAYNPATDTWARWGDSYGGSDYEASVAMDVSGRKMYVLGGQIAEVVDLDTHVVTSLGIWDGTKATGPGWAKIFLTPAWFGGTLKGPGVQWHPGRQRILAYVQRNATNGTEQNILQIDPVKGTVETLQMAGVRVATVPGFSILGRFRLIPGTDTVVLAGAVDTNVFVGQLPARGVVQTD